MFLRRDKDQLKSAEAAGRPVGPGEKKKMKA